MLTMEKCLQTLSECGVTHQTIQHSFASTSLRRTECLSGSDAALLQKKLCEGSFVSVCARPARLHCLWCRLRALWPIDMSYCGSPEGARRSELGHNMRTSTSSSPRHLHPQDVASGSSSSKCVLLLALVCVCLHSASALGLFVLSFAIALAYRHVILWIVTGSEEKRAWT